jgi:thiol:disulfide interchange protein DsbA
MANQRKKFLQQQKLFLGGVAVVVVAIALYFTSVVISDSQSGEFVEGEHYFLIDEPRRIRGKRIEVMEFFSYGCIHCYNFDEEIHAWAEARADTVKLIQTPAVANQQWQNYGRAYYTMESLGLLEDGHTLMFKLIHDAARNLTRPGDFAAALASGDVSEAAFVSTFTSNAISEKIRRADQLARQSRVATVPSLVVNGKYHIRVSGSIGYSRMLDVADYLIEKEIAERTGASSPAN